MQIDILYGPGNPMAKIYLDRGQTCIAEGGTMVAMDGHLSIHTTTQQVSRGGLISGMKRLLVDESFFLNHFSSRSTGGSVWLAPANAGDLATIELNNQRVFVQGGSYLACEGGVHIDMGWQGFKSMFSGENFFWLTAQGAGYLLLSAFGAIYSVDVYGEYIVDTGHIVAFEDSLEFSITKAGSSWISSYLGGEGLVCRFEGQGRLWCQSHNPQSYGESIGKLLPPIEVGE